MATVSDAQLRQLKKFMDDSSLTCTEEWLAACVNWIQENYPVVNLELLRKELRVQWRDTNLEEMESSCLPPNLTGQKLAKLTGKYGLQINSVRDIGESSYSQWQKLKKLENDNTSVAATDSNEYKQSWQPTPKRCLFLKMTDGVQQVSGMEMQPIPGLSLNLKPGLKVVILGPVECRRGVFHLRPNNIRIEGGEVEDLLESNTMDKILADILKVPAGNRSRTQTQTSTSSSRNPFQTQAPSSNTTDAVSGDFPDDTHDQFPDMEVFGDDDDIFMEIDEEALISSATAGTGPSTSSSSNITSASNLSSRPTTTSRISRSTNFTDDIEDFEDDPGFTRSTISSSSTNSKPAIPSGSAFSSNLTRPVPGPASKSTVPTNSAKPKPVVFMPPPAKPKTPAIAKVTVPAPTSLFSSNKGTTKKTIPPSSSSNSKSGDSALPGFSTAKSALSAGSSGSAGSGKQMKISTFLKPMPVIIDPPTPERRLKRRRKSLEEGVLTVKQEQPPLSSSSVPIKMEDDSDMLAESEFESASAYENPPQMDDFGYDDENDRAANSPSPDLDDSLMRIVDEAVEKRLSEHFEPDDDLVEPPPKSKPSTSTSNQTNAGVITTRKLTYPIKVPEYPYVFIQQIQENLSGLASKRKVVNVKACISTVVSNIKVENGCWNLEVCVNDGTGYMNCTIRSALLNDIIGFSPAEMKVIKATKTKEGKQKIAEAMNGLATRLVHLNAILSIEMGEQPAIIQITDLMLHHCTALKEILSKVG